MIYLGMEKCKGDALALEIRPASLLQRDKSLGVSPSQWGGETFLAPHGTPSFQSKRTYTCFLNYDPQGYG